ncbi:MAG: arylesterase [Rhodospirillales bacterium]|nr:arylesterase [Rhodospirillales bacterium]
MRLFVNAFVIFACLAAWPAAAEVTRIIALGDSLTAGYGLARPVSFTERLQWALRNAGVQAIVENAGVSGDTSAGGLARLDWALAPKAGKPADALIVELGANDGLRGIDPASTEKNLDAIIQKARARGLPVLLAGMMAPPNLGREYGAEFNGIFPRLANKHGVALYPFFLDGVAAISHLNQRDGIHPNAAGVDVIVKRMLPHVKKLITAP